MGADYMIGAFATNVAYFIWEKRPKTIQNPPKKRKKKKNQSNKQTNNRHNNRLPKNTATVDADAERFTNKCFKRQSLNFVECVLLLVRRFGFFVSHALRHIIYHIYISVIPFSLIFIA